MMSDGDQETKLGNQYSQFIVDMLHQGHSVKLKVSGRSMYPCILSGSEVTITPIARDALKHIKRGELILCLIMIKPDSQSWVLHRVVNHRRKKRILVMGGDRLPINDEERMYEQILGRVSRVSLPQLSQLGLIQQFLAKLTQAAPQSFWSRYLGLVNLYLYRCFWSLRSILGWFVKTLG